MLATLAVGGSFGATSAPAALNRADLSVYRGSADAAGIGQFEAWLGSPVRRSLDFLSGETWASIESPTWWADSWAESRYRATYSVPLLPSTGGTLAEGATGAYNEHFVRLAQTLVASGEGDAVLRLGWEFNGPWYRWSAANDPDAFVAYWRQIVDAMRAVPGAAFTFDWCPALGTLAIAADRVYPGDAYVDYIGLDVYDQDWHPGWQDPVRRWQNFLTQPHGLRWHRDFAAAHGKAMSFPEFALVIRSDGHGGGDNPYFVQRMYEWIEANNVAYANYFEFDASDGQHSLLGGRFPLAAERFRTLFGSGSSAPSAAPPAAPSLSLRPAPALPTNLVRPSIGGVAAKKAALTASSGTWSSSNASSYSFRWLRCNRAGAACKTVSGATASTFVPGRPDVGRRLRVAVTVANAAGSRSATSEPTAIVASRASSTGYALAPAVRSSIRRLVSRWIARAQPA